MQDIVGKVQLVRFREYDGTDIENFKAWYLSTALWSTFVSNTNGILVFTMEFVGTVTIQPGDWINLDSPGYPVSPEDMAAKWGNPGA